MNRDALSALEHLNQLALTPAEQDEVLAFFAHREAAWTAHDGIDTANVERQVYARPVMSQIVEPRTNVLRQDVAAQPFSRDALLKQAPESMDGYWQVPRVLQ